MPSRTLITREKSIPGFKGQPNFFARGKVAGELKLKLMLIYPRAFELG